MNKKRAIHHSTRNYILILLLLTIACIHDILFEKLFNFLKISTDIPTKKYSVANSVITGLLIAPLIETLLFQYLPLKGLLYINSINKKAYFKWVFVILSTVLFSVSHSYSWIYIVVTIIPGFILSYYFYFFYKSYNLSTAFYFIGLLHFLKNTIALTDKYFF